MDTHRWDGDDGIYENRKDEGFVLEIPIQVSLTCEDFYSPLFIFFSFFSEVFRDVTACCVRLYY